MFSFIKSKLMPLFISPEFLIFDKTRRSRIIILFALILVSFGLLLFMHVNYIRYFDKTPPHLSILFCIVSFLGTYLWLSKKLEKDIFRLVICKMSFIQFKYEIFALLIFIRYILVVSFFGFILVVSIGGVVYLFVR